MVVLYEGKSVLNWIREAPSMLGLIISFYFLGSGQSDIKYYVQMFDRAARKITNLKSFKSEYLYPRITGKSSKAYVLR